MLPENLGGRERLQKRKGYLMKLRTWLSLLLAAVLVSGLIAPSGLAAKKKPKKAGPVVVGTDAADDWGSNAPVPGLQPIGSALGQELVEATIAPVDAETVNFIIKVAGLPPTGGAPEFSRYGWDFTVDGEAFSMSGAFTDYLRGVCYPAHANMCPPNPPSDPGMQPFYIRSGPCTISPQPDGSISDCTLLATVQATYDTAAGTITIPVPLEAIGAKPGSVIGPGVNQVFGATLYAVPAVVTAQAASPHDVMMAMGTFTVPKK